jgi:hypothetical protein
MEPTLQLGMILGFQLMNQSCLMQCRLKQRTTSRMSETDWSLRWDAQSYINFALVAKLRHLKLAPPC